jgi:hypothetical protein
MSYPETTKDYYFQEPLQEFMREYRKGFYHLLDDGFSLWKVYPEREDDKFVQITDQDTIDTLAVSAASFIRVFYP